MDFLYPDYEAESITWSVSELTAYIRELFDIDYRLQDVRIEGEISNFIRARSGHLYFTLKDEGAQLKCVMWRSWVEKHSRLPQDGDAVVARGRISVYEAGGVYQLYAESIERAGRGDLALAFEQMKEKLAREGLFDSIHKRAIPTFPNKIGLVTSADAAALQDILNVLRRRWPIVSVLIAPTLVQGRDAPPNIVQALRWLDGRDDIDSIIIARGGGSIEDLWAFNDEAVARAIFAAQHPIIVGVGHETDFTIADFVADLRAPTPSAAAELSVPDRTEIEEFLKSLNATMTTKITAIIREGEMHLNGIRRSLKHLSPRSTLDNNRQKVDWLLNREDQAMIYLLESRKTRLSLARATLESLNPTSTLSRGYAIVRKKDGTIVRSVSDVRLGQGLDVQVSDGQFDVVVSEGEGYGN